MNLDFDLVYLVSIFVQKIFIFIFICLFRNILALWLVDQFFKDLKKNLRKPGKFKITQERFFDSKCGNSVFKTGFYHKFYLILEMYKKTWTFKIFKKI